MAGLQRFVYHQIMNVEDHDARVAGLASAIGEPTRARMLYHLLDGHAHTSTELAVVGGVSPSTASAHLERLRGQRLVKVLAQGKHRYYSVAGLEVAAVLESLRVLAGEPRHGFVPSTPVHLREARTCYDHIAGVLGVALHDRLCALGWLTEASAKDQGYGITPCGKIGFAELGIDVDAARTRRRRFAYRCVDWSERRPHLAGALGAALLEAALQRKWVARELESRALEITRRGRREMEERLGVRV